MFGPVGTEGGGIGPLFEDGGTSFEGWSIPEIEVHVY